MALGVLVALGTWQLERKAWKDQLIAQLDTKLSALRVESGQVSARQKLEQLKAAAANKALTQKKTM